MTPSTDRAGPARPRVAMAEATERMAHMLQAQDLPADDDLTYREQSDIDQMQSQLDRLDIELMSLVRKRTALACQLGAARVEAGGTRIVYQRQASLVRQFAKLGPTGTELAVLLLRLERQGGGRLTEPGVEPGVELARSRDAAQYPAKKGRDNRMQEDHP